MQAIGPAEVRRHPVPGLFNLRFNRWFGWDGAQGSLWAQNLRPLLDAREMGVGSGGAAQLVCSDRQLSCGARRYSTIDEERLHAGGERILRRLDLSARERADLVAFLETLTERQRLHEFVEDTGNVVCR